MFKAAHMKPGMHLIWTVTFDVYKVVGGRQESLLEGAFADKELPERLQRQIERALVRLFNEDRFQY